VRKKIEPVRLKMLRRRYAKMAVDVAEAHDLLGNDAPDKDIVAATTNEVREVGKTYNFSPRIARRLVEIGAAEPAEAEPEKKPESKDSEKSTGKK
jgi:hypothetical protein